ncbi:MULTISPECIES: hypothetical protein [Lonsdalea]|uniref:hypothetical protein n=1 Tax=Lonsdalea TaxID=1082702 RepID=UPI00283A905D|nr:MULTISPECIES: hypothetical protein [Lonsdalea]
MNFGSTAIEETSMPGHSVTAAPSCGALVKTCQSIAGMTLHKPMLKDRFLSF